MPVATTSDQTAGLAWSSMEFEGPTHRFRGALGAIFIWGFAFALAAPFVWYTVLDWPSGFMIFLDVVLAPLCLTLVWLAWIGSLHLKVDLSNSPREARCWRKNIFTRIKTFHRYPIRDDAKVIVDRDGAHGDSGGKSVWPVNIEGLPKYYDFYILGRGRGYDDAWAIGRTLASFLGIRFVDSKGDEHAVHDRGSKMWYGPRPEVDESPRGRRRRRRKRA